MELTWLDGQMMRQRKNKCRDDEAFVATNLSQNATNSSARYVGWTAWCFFFSKALAFNAGENYYAGSAKGIDWLMRGLVFTYARMV